jgi:hypothetical protein
MVEFIYRTEDIRIEDLSTYFVETEQDRNIINSLKSSNPIVLVGSRGVGKSFLLRVAETEMTSSFTENKVFPIYITFNRSSLIHTSDTQQFQHWMLTRLCSSIIRGLRKTGHLASIRSEVSIIAGGNIQTEKTRIEQMEEEFESSWKSPGKTVNTEGLPKLEDFKNAIEDLCETHGFRRFAFFIDEAAHIFLPEQQRTFFTLFRDLRSPYITCNAAVYPGVTSYGDTFQPNHDATFIELNRSIYHHDYVKHMREIVEKQADTGLLRAIKDNVGNFNILAYAADGNPRILLKTVQKAPKMNARDINELMRTYYRVEVWKDHSDLAEKYPGHHSLIDWGRKFMEEEVLPKIHERNQKFREKETTCFFWIHRNAPHAVKEALRLLAYVGIVNQNSTGIKSSKSEIGTRYSINLGCLFAQESDPASGNSLYSNFSQYLQIDRMTEFGANHNAYRSLTVQMQAFDETDSGDILRKQLKRPIDALDMSPFFKNKLTEMGLNTVGDVLNTPEERLQDAYQIGPSRSRKMHNIASAAILEYLSG